MMGQVAKRVALNESNLYSCCIIQHTANMRAATRLLPAVVILAGLFLITTYLYRLPITDAFHGSNFKSLVDVEDDPLRGVNETVDPATTSAPNDGRFEAIATSLDRTSATATATVEEQTSATETSLSSLDQIVVIGKTESEDTSWVEKLPTLVFSAAWILPCDKG
jgi:hypothetical protein